jgi:hypothetical protein
MALGARLSFAPCAFCNCNMVVFLSLESEVLRAAKLWTGEAVKSEAVKQTFSKPLRAAVTGQFDV